MIEVSNVVMGKDQMEEVKYLEIADNPEYRDLRLSEKRDVEDRAIAKAQDKISLRIGRLVGMREMMHWVNRYYEGKCILSSTEGVAKLRELGMERCPKCKMLVPSNAVHRCGIKPEVIHEEEGD